jgi:predicted amidohydrolase YtcJ
VEQEGAQSLRLFQSLDGQGELFLRVHHHIVDDFVDEVTALGLQAGFGNERLWLGHIKNFSDGTLGSRTALMIEPFEGETDNYGFIITPPERLAKLTWQANQAGFPVSVHAIGDQAVRQVIEVLAEYSPETTNSSALPHRIEHVQLIHPDDLPILGASNIFASVQPVHLLTDWYVADEAWGKRSRYAYAFRSMLDHGIPLAFGSDAPVAPLYLCCNHSPR